jgi:hypothetical protein
MCREETVVFDESVGVFYERVLVHIEAILMFCESIMVHIESVLLHREHFRQGPGPISLPFQPERLDASPSRGCVPLSKRCKQLRVEGEEMLGEHSFP